MTVTYNTYLAKRRFAGEAKYYELSFPTGAIIIAPAGQEGSKIWWGQYLNQGGLFPSEYVRLVEKSKDYANTAEVPVIAQFINNSPTITTNGKKQPVKKGVEDSHYNNDKDNDKHETRDSDPTIAEEEKTFFTTTNNNNSRDDGAAIRSNASAGGKTFFTSNTKSKYGSLPTVLAKKVNLPKCSGKNKNNSNNETVDDRTFTLLGEKFQTDICFALLGTKKPTLPLREELRSLGFEIVLRTLDTSYPTKQLNFTRAYKYKMLNKKLKRLSKPSFTDRLSACWRISTTTPKEYREPTGGRRKNSNTYDDERRVPAEKNDWLGKPSTKKGQTTLADILCGAYSRHEINSLLIENVITFDVQDVESVVSDTTEVDYGIHLNGRTVPSIRRSGKGQSSKQSNNNKNNSVIGTSVAVGNTQEDQRNNSISRDDDKNKIETYKNTVPGSSLDDGDDRMMTFVFPDAEHQARMNSPLFPLPDMYVEKGTTTKTKKTGDYDYISNVGGNVQNSLSTRIYNTNVNIQAVKDEYPTLSETMSGHDLHWI